MLTYLAGSAAMFDVYLNRRGDLLVVPNGLPLPNKEMGRWRKKTTKVAAVSDEIRLAIQRWGYIGASSVNGFHLQPDRSTKSNVISKPHLLYCFADDAPNTVAPLNDRWAGHSKVGLAKSHSAVNNTPRSALSTISWSRRTFSFILFGQRQSAISDCARIAHGDTSRSANCWSRPAWRSTKSWMFDGVEPRRERYAP
jgi:hypothetical protein